VRRSRRLLIAAVGLIAVAAAVVGSLMLLRAAQTAPSIAHTGAPAPQIALPVVGGGTSNLEGERGKVVLVNFWATWCEPCRSEMPALQHLADDLHDQPFVVYSVDLQEDAERVDAFKRELGLTLYAVLDDNGDVTRSYGVHALPATFLIDQRGVLREQRLGPLLNGAADTVWSAAWLSAQVRTLLATT